MRYLLIIFLMTFCYGLSAQLLNDLALVERSISKRDIVDSRPSHIKVNQFFDTCIYDEKCGIFMKKGFAQFGFIKGFFLSIDRRLRCTSLTRSRALPIRFNKEGFIKDHAEDYSVKED
ncbi:hypothetical protein [Ekhidna sp.]|uniref:hypothetical protein n=1 Tax=Ekhidna sp. TaxID=2608089 RepID=UPI003BAA936E